MFVESMKVMDALPPPPHGRVCELRDAEEEEGGGARMYGEASSGGKKSLHPLPPSIHPSTTSTTQHPNATLHFTSLHFTTYWFSFSPRLVVGYALDGNLDGLEDVGVESEMILAEMVLGGWGGFVLFR